MTTIPARDLRQALTGKLGYQRVQGAKHEKLRLSLDGRVVAQTALSHGREPIREKLLGIIARQIGVTSRELHAIVDCSMTRDQYISHVAKD